MTSSDATLQSLRRQIDRIDDQLHDLLMARAAMVEQVAAAKPGSAVLLRPGREAEILRRLAARHAGPFPKGALMRIWREVIGASAGIQAPLSVAVAGEGLADLARDHFGVVCTITASTSPGQVVKLVDEGKVTVGVLPMPAGPMRDPSAAAGDQPIAPTAEPWWRSLAAEREEMPRVVSRLPFYPFAPETRAALVIARRPHDETGNDRTLLVIEAGTDVSRDRIRSLLTAAGFDLMATLGNHAAGGSSLHLLEVDGWCAPGDARLAQLVRDPIRHAGIVGGYPVPLPP